MSFADWLWSVLAPALGLNYCTGAWLENDTRRVRHKQYTHGHCICPPHCTTHLWLEKLHTPCVVRCENQQKSRVITSATIRHEKWNNCPHFVIWLSANKRNTSERWRVENTSLGLNLGFQRAGYKIYNAFIHLQYERLYLTNIVRKTPTDLWSRRTKNDIPHRYNGCVVLVDAVTISCVVHPV